MENAAGRCRDRRIRVSYLLHVVVVIIHISRCDPATVLGCLVTVVVISVRDEGRAVLQRRDLPERVVRERQRLAALLMFQGHVAEVVVSERRPFPSEQLASQPLVP